MAIQRKQNFLGGQRVDVPHLRAIESGVAADFAELVNGFISDGFTNHIIRGLSHNAESSTVARGSWAITVANSVVLSKTDEICLFAFPSTAPVIYPFQTGTFSDGVTYYVGITISSVTHDPQIVKFLDDVTNTEISKTVPLALVLDYVVQPTATAVNTDPNTIWIYEVQSVGGLITAANVSYPTGTRYPFMVGTTKYTNLLDWIQAVYIAGINGPAGGILGYNGSSQYPNPNGLAPLDGVIGPLDEIPIKAGTTTVDFVVDAATTVGANGSDLGLYSAKGGESDSGSTASGKGGDLALHAGDAGVDNGAGPGNGGEVSVKSGRGLSGGDLFVRTGIGYFASNSGMVIVRDHDLSSKTGAPPDGMTGGGIEISTVRGGTGNGAIAPGSGGAIEISTGQGGAADFFDAGFGGQIDIVAGDGGAASATNQAGLGGQIQIVAGDGGAGTATISSAAGSSVTIEAGSSGGDGGGGGADGGGVFISAGNGNSTNSSGTVQITTAPISVAGVVPTLDAPSNGLSGGNFLVKNQEGGEGDLTSAPGTGGSSLIFCGDGGDSGTASANGAVGGGLSIQTGAGGSGTVGFAGGDGGAVFIQASAGGPSGGGTAGDGGAIALVTGTGGSAGAGTGGQGGSLIIGCGLSTGNRNGGNFLATAGLAGGSGTGGSMSLYGGNTDTGTGGNAGIGGGSATGAGTGGNVSVQGGNGSVADGDVLIGTLNGAKVDIGIVNRNVTTIGRDVGNVVDYPAVAGTTIPVTSPVIQFTNGSAQAMSGTTPQIQTSGITKGTRLTLLGGANSVSLDRDSHVAGSGLRLTANTHIVNQYDSLELVFNGTEWIQISYSQNS